MAADDGTLASYTWIQCSPDRIWSVDMQMHAAIGGSGSGSGGEVVAWWCGTMVRTLQEIN